MASQNVFQMDRYSIFKCPISPWTKILKYILECKKYKNFTKKGQTDFKPKQQKIEEDLEKQELLVNISMLCESGFESSFQFLFQGTYMLPILILAFMDIDGANPFRNLLDLRILSIILSFFTYSFTSYKLR